MIEKKLLLSIQKIYFFFAEKSKKGEKFSKHNIKFVRIERGDGLTPIITEKYYTNTY